MNPKKLLAVMLALVLILGSTGVLAYAQGLEGMTTPSEPGETVDETVPAGLLPVMPGDSEQETTEDGDVSNAVMPGENSEPSSEESDVSADVPEEEPDAPQDGMMPAPDGEPSEEEPDAEQGEPASDAETSDEEPPQGEAGASCVNRPSVNLRAEPDVESARVGKLTYGERVEVKARVLNAQGEAWYAVTWQGQEGFIRADLLNAVDDVPLMRCDGQNLVPVNETPATEDQQPDVPETDETPDAPETDDEQSDETPDAPETDGDQPDETLDEPETDDKLTDETSDATASEADQSEADGSEAGETEKPETPEQEEPDPEETPADGEPEQTVPKYDVTYLNADGSVLDVYTVEAGTVFDEEVFIAVEGEFLGWYPCDETGAWTGDAPYDFGQPIEGAVYVRAKVNAPQTEAAEAERRIAVSAASDTAEPELGSRITLTAELEGYEGLNYTCRWQYAAADRDGNITGEWQDAQADSLSFGYVLTEENLLTAWRMCVTVHEE